MRLQQTEEMKRIWDEISPYLVFSGLDVLFKDGTPDRIVKLKEEYVRLGRAQREEAMSW